MFVFMGRQPASAVAATADIDDSEWPILLARPSAGATTDDHRKHLSRITKAAVARREPFVLLIDASNQPERPDAVRRKATADEMLACYQKYPGLMRGLGVVLASGQASYVITHTGTRGRVSVQR